MTEGRTGGEGTLIESLLKRKNKILISELVKNDGFDQNGGHRELRHKKIMNFESGVVDFRIMATHFVNIFVFLLILLFF